MAHRFDATARARARTAYETLEPMHVLCYFNPGLGAAQADTGLDAYAFYVGARGAPLGECVPSVVSAAFYNFSEGIVHPGWEAAKAVGLDHVARRRDAMLAESLAHVYGDAADPATLTALADRFYAIAARAPMAGRTLASAWAHVSRPDDPAVALWHAVAILREWRGDGHIAALVGATLDRLEAVVFHEARHPDPAIRKRGLGRRMSQLTRGWSDEQWDTAADGLVDRGLLSRSTDDAGKVTDTLTDAGAALYADIEEITDDSAAAAWADVDDFDDLMASTRPFVKAVIDAGVLPGTKKK
ncbi:SCO6745 family protein [Williamsia herbipolensis]|uniref:SCO6745 family protein n=1 Tax=Williamsia herbipolensis TaxID=1603258 RepID=UPI0005F7B4F3|nr:hypothetical protein [Williamsia herbipolensis]